MDDRLAEVTNSRDEKELDLITREGENTDA